MLKTRKILSILLVIVAVVGVMTGCRQTTDKSFTRMEDFEQAKIGVMTGSSFDVLAQEHLPRAEKFYYASFADLFLSLRQGKIDGVLIDEAFYAPLCWEDTGLSSIEMEMPAIEYAVAFPKTSVALKSQMDEFIRARTEDGWIDELKKKWFSGQEPSSNVDMTQLTGENGTLRVAATADSKPFAYLKNEELCGLDVDLVFAFAKEYGYALEFDTMDFGAILPSLAAGRYDFAATGITVTEERKESALFSETYCSSSVVMAVAANGDATHTEKSFADFSTAKIGVITGSSHEGTVKKLFPDAERVYFNTMADMILAVEQGKIDCYIEDFPFVAPLIWEGRSLEIIDDSPEQVNNGFVFPQAEESRALREQINAFLTEAKANGTIDRLRQKWLGAVEPTDIPDYASLGGENGTIRLAVSVDNKPMLYQRGDDYTGFEMELLTLFAKQAGYAFEIEVVPFESIIAGISAGKYDMAASSLNITPEREESVDFSDPYGAFHVVLVIKGKEKLQSKMTLADLENATIGIVTGTNYDNIVKERFPNAARKYFTTTADAWLALEQGKIDSFLADKSVYAAVRWENKEIASIDEPVEPISNALILAKNGYDEKLLAQLNEFIADSKADGTLKRLEAKWFGESEPQEHPDYTKLTGENGTLRIAVSDSMKPTAYQKGSMYTGYDVDFLTLFAEKYGYKLDVRGMAFDALIPTVASGKCDIGAAGITITQERMESVTFTDPNCVTYSVAVISEKTANNGNTRTLMDFNNATIGILTGSSYDPLAKERFPNAKRKYYSLMTDLVLAVEQGKVDGYISETTYYTALVWEGAQIEKVDEAIERTNAGFIFQKDGANAAIREQLDSFIIESKENGLLTRLQEKWLGDTEPNEAFDSNSLTGENGTLKVAVSPDLKPLCYVKDGKIVGYEIEVLQYFAKEYGYHLEFVTMTFDGILPSVLAGKCDIGTGGMTITEERAQSVDFTESYLTVDVVMVVKAGAEATATVSIWDEIKEDFRKTFIREDRWKLIVKGIGVTMLISISAAAAGTLLGFGLYMLSRSDVKAIQALAKGFARGYSRVIAGTPVVVILMILFYVVFGKIRDMSGIVVAVIGFTLTFGSFVYDHMTVSVSSVDGGQTEAAYALGYTKNQTFFRIIFPQAMKIFLPSYCGQAVELVKATAVVGYIAVNDLTKMGDIIRSNTYEAFFPLIATAIIYFLLTWILSMLLGLVKLHFEPKRRGNKDILKGVKTK